MNSRISSETTPIENDPGLAASHSGAPDFVDRRAQVLLFGGFAFDLRRGELKDGDGVQLALRPKAELLLRQFLAQPGRLLGRDELISAVWPSAVVTDDSLVQCVGELRSALGDRSQRLIRTVPRRGYRFDAQVEAVAELPVPDAASPGVAPARASPYRLRRALIAAGVLLALASSAAYWRYAARGPVHLDDEIAARHVITVIPFSSPSGDARLREVADQTADDIAAQIAARMGMRSIGRAATAAGIASKATYVVNGRVDRAQESEGGTVIDVQIVAAADGTLIAAEHFATGESPGSVRLGDVGSQVANLLRGRIGDIDHLLATGPGHRLDAADLTLLGWWELDRRRGADGLLQARSHFEQALRSDPESTMALAGLGAALLTARMSRVALSPAEIAESEHVIEHARLIAPSDATASLLWASLQLVKGRADLAMPAIERANRTVPSYGNGYLLQAKALLMLGRLDEVQAPAERAAQLATLARDAPRVSAAYTVAAEASLMLGQDAKASEFAQRAVAERPSNAAAHAVLAAANALGGREIDAAVEMAAYRKLEPRATVAGYDEFQPSLDPVYRAQRERLFEGLRKAGLP